MARLVRGEDLNTDFSPGRRTKPLEGSSITQLIDIFRDLTFREGWPATRFGSFFRSSLARWVTLPTGDVQDARRGFHLRSGIFDKLEDSD